jgi:PAS domain S-box-containing protein
LFVELVARLVGQALERRRHDRVLRERNAQLEAEKRRAKRIADTTFDLLFEIDPDARLTYASRGTEAILGRAPDDVTGTSFADHIAPSSLSTAVEAFERVLGGESIRNLELTARRGDGEAAVIEINGTPVVEDGTVVAAQGVARDITERREREDELRLKTRAIDDASVGVTIADATRPDHPIVYANRAFETLTGYDRETVTGESWRLRRGPATDENALEAFRERIAASEPASADLINYRRNGAPFWNNVRVVPVEDDGAVTHLVGFQQDVTDRVRTERLIQLLNRVLRHNLRNELNVLLGYGDLLTDSDAASASEIDAGRVVSDTVSRMLSLSDQVRELETIARQDRDPAFLDVPELLSDAVSGLRREYPDATIDVSVDLPASRGICAGIELRRAIEELVDNALSHDDDLSTTVTMTASSAGESVEIVVVDDGPGIPSIEAAVIETGRETQIDHGRGLGLWLVNWIVTRYGGSFQVRPASEREDASGTVATVSLPAIDADESVADAVRPHTTLFQ